jgi:hypothetical protein
MPRSLPLAAALFVVGLDATAVRAQPDRDPKIDQAVSRGLDFLAREQRRQGYWEANGGQYRVAMTALAATALLCEGSTTTRGKYAENISLAVDFLLDCAQPSGLIGYQEDYRYTYGHGFSMLCLSQVFGEEEDADRRERIRKVLTKAVEFCAYAQTTQGGWGYVSARDGNDFDEGSTCVTQVQGLRACRNAGIPVAKEIIDRAHKYIENCLTPDGGIQYSIKRAGGARPPITAAAVATLFSTGDYEGEMVQRMLEYCAKNVWPGGGGLDSNFGHWHYAHYYYSQVMYRQGDEEWAKYIKSVGPQILRSQSADGSWKEGNVGPVYTTAINATILQIDKGYLPIYQR